MGLDAGSAQGQLSLDYQEFVDGFDQAANAAKRAGDSIGTGMSSAKKTIADLETELALGSKSAQVFGQSGDLLKERQAQLKSGIVSLLREGIEPNSEAIKELKTQYDETSKELKQYENATDNLTDKLGSLVATAGTMATLKAAVSGVMGSMADFAEAELATDRLRKALEFKGLEGSMTMFTDLGSRLQTLTGVSNNVIEQMAAEAIAQGKNVQQAYDLINASAAFASVTGKDVNAVYQQLNKTYSGLAGELGESVPAIRGMTAEQLANGAAVEYMMNEYGAYVGQVGKTKIAMDNMNQTMGDASETIGSALAPMVLLVVDGITSLASVVANAGTVMKTILGVGATALITVFTALAIRTAVVAAAKWGLFGAQMAVNAAMAVGNPLLWVGIAAAGGVVAATGALIASKVREARATKASAEATKENTNRMRTASEVVGKYAGQIDAFSVSQLKGARAELVAAQSRAKYADEIIKIGKKITEIDALIARKNKEAMDATEAEKYSTAMESVNKTLEDTLTSEQRLVAEIESVEKVRGASAAEEKKRQQALEIMYSRLAEIREENAEAEREEYRANRDAYNAMMGDIFKVIDERRVREQELKAQIEKLEDFKAESQEDEKARLLAIADLTKDLARVQDEIDGVSMWQEAQYALDDYVESMKKGQLTVKSLSKALTSAVSSIYSGAQDIVSQYFTNQTAATENEYAAQLEALEEKRAGELITEEEYAAEKERIEEEAAKKKNEIAEKQFESEKLQRIASVWMNAGQSVAGWWAVAPQLGFPAGPIFAGVMTGATMTMATVQTAMIAEQEFVPSYASGGTHSGGPAQINEEGGEIVHLPDGTVIVPRDLSEQVAEGSGNYSRQEINVSFAGATITKDVNLDVLADKVSRQIARRVRR